MKHYKPDYKTPRTYADKRHRIFSARKSKAFVPDTDEIIEEDMELGACSSYDCTGLIPAALQSDAEARAYEDIYPYIAPASKTE